MANCLYLHEALSQNLNFISSTTHLLTWYMQGFNPIHFVENSVHQHYIKIDIESLFTKCCTHTKHP